MQTDARSRAVPVLVALVATVAMSLLLGLVFESDIQQIDADELVARSDDARAFLIADYVFILLFAVVTPLVIWRFGSAIGGGSPPWWIAAAALLLLAAGIVDAVEDTLLLTATGSVSADAVDAAHALEVPKFALFIAGAVPALVADFRALQELRRG